MCKLTNNEKQELLEEFVRPGHGPLIYYKEDATMQEKLLVWIEESIKLAQHRISSQFLSSSELQNDTGYMHALIDIKRKIKEYASTTQVLDTPL